MSSELDILTLLKSQLVNFLDELIESFPEEPDFVIFRIFVKDQIPMADIMNYIVESLLPLEEMVKARDEKFFLNYNVLFETFNENHNSKVNHFRRLWMSDTVDQEDRNVIWQWFDSFLSLAKKYKEIREQTAVKAN